MRIINKLKPDEIISIGAKSTVGADKANEFFMIYR